MTSTDPSSSDRRESAPASVADAISGYVTDLARVPPGELFVWLPELQVVAGWQVGRAENSVVQPTRIAVHGHDLNAGWDACEILNMFTFAGSPPVDTVRLNADCSLRALGADDIAVATLHPSSATPIAAVCSSGYLNLAEHQRIWAQSNTYIASDDTRGLLVEQSIFVGMERLSTLTDDITRLSEALRNALNQCVRLPHPSSEHRGGADSSPRSRQAYDDAWVGRWRPGSEGKYSPG